MSTFLLAFFAFTCVMLAMAIGVIINNRVIKGSCGGLNDIEGLEGACDICEIKSQCKRRRRVQRKALLDNYNSDKGSDV
ncbi:MAG: (Na+)-NQR maturation NqrM [Acidiferrobacterales bacterium]|nr:(Na+)-NQR maturation NqrM [Acidiferrobacterales bacterium]